MSLTEYSCPNCGATLTISTFGYQGTCEYCGSKYHIDPSGVKADDGRNYTQMMQEKLEEEKRLRAQQMAQEGMQQDGWEKAAQSIFMAADAVYNVSHMGRRVFRWIRRIFGFIFGLVILGLILWLLVTFLPIMMH